METLDQNPKTHCIRCGECCLRSSPSLHLRDLPLLEKDLIRRSALFTIRRGEWVWDNIGRRLAVADREMIKIKGVDGDRGACIFYDDTLKACTIYPHRPAQCGVLKCWDTAEFMEVYRAPKLARADIFPAGPLTGLVAEHERRCGYEGLENLVKRIQREGEDAVKAVLEVLRFDFHIRPFVSEKLGIDADEMDFIFGRPMIQTISRFGLKVILEPDGSCFLTTITGDR
ncbi:MAG: YkgJ family cysteine cluster protein [Deltaproteobacteria bacterium]|nr:YkgJ family cysteine cluster protein [Deltaproteobacteria bacterium]